MDEFLMKRHSFWKNRRVFITGHTGFKGSWFSLWLASLGARITGYALPPEGDNPLFETIGADKDVSTVWGDIRDFERLAAAVRLTEPEIVFHLAAQPLVRASYRAPVDTYAVNVMGTVHLLEAVRLSAEAGNPVKAVVNVTTDKCYDNREWVWGYRESDPLGGHDPYSSSKACSELVTRAYRSSYFPESAYGSHGLGMATARAGNVIGGGDDAADRLVPDCLRSFAAGKRPLLRSPGSTRPWQHVLEPLAGYMQLAERLTEAGGEFASAWNFGPGEGGAMCVAEVADRLAALWGDGAGCDRAEGCMPPGPHEAGELMLDSAKSRRMLGWHPRWNTDQALKRTVEWHKAYAGRQDMREFSLKQISDYMTGP